MILNFIIIIAFSIKNLISPSLEARIYRKIIKPNIQDFNNVSYMIIIFLTIIAMIVPSILSSGIISDMFPVYLVIFMVLSAVVGIAIFSSSLLVLGTANGIMNSLCIKQTQSKPDVDQLTWIVDKYHQFNDISSPYIFLTFTLNVLALIISLYLIAIDLTGCSFHFVSIV